MAIFYLVRDEEKERNINVLRPHSESLRIIAAVMNVSKEKSKAIAKRGRDKIVAAYLDGKL